MASFELTSVPMWLTGCTYDGNGGDDLRNSGVTALLYPLGPASGTSAGAPTGVLGTGLKVSASSGMNVTVSGGSFAVSSPTASNGGYIACLASDITLTVAASDPSDVRIDLVCATVVDNGNSTSLGKIQIIEGTPIGSSPSPPSTPASSARLAYIAVGAGVTSIVSGDITGERSYTCAVGGIVPQPMAFAPAGYNGAYGYDAPSDRLYHNAASGPRQPRLLPFAPQMSLWTSNQFLNPSGNPPTTLASVTIDADGVTDIKVTYHVPGLEQPSPEQCQVKFAVTVDGTQIDETDIQVNSFDLAGISMYGFTGVYHTSSAGSDTPSAGTHTVALTGIAEAPSANVAAVANSGRHGYLRVEPVTL